jgi:hypothetical protein
MRRNAKRCILMSGSIDKAGQILALHQINDLLHRSKQHATIYLLGGNALISQDIVSRTTKDIDIFLIAENNSTILRQEIMQHLNESGILIDVGVNGEFPIAGKQFT